MMDFSTAWRLSLESSRGIDGGTVGAAIEAALRAEIDRLRAMINGREKPPSVEEMRAHAAAHPWGGDKTMGRWIVRAEKASNGAEASAVVALQCLPDGRCLAGTPGGGWQLLPPNPDGQHDPGSLWWPIDRNGLLCDWPVTS